MNEPWREIFESKLQKSVDRVLLNDGKSICCESRKCINKSNVTKFECNILHLEFSKLVDEASHIRKEMLGPICEWNGDRRKNNEHDKRHTQKKNTHTENGEERINKKNALTESSKAQRVVKANGIWVKCDFHIVSLLLQCVCACELCLLHTAHGHQSLLIPFCHSPHQMGISVSPFIRTESLILLRLSLVLNDGRDTQSCTRQYNYR